MAAYWFTFRYEVGYLSHFGLPSQIVEVSLQTALLVTAGSWSGIVFFFFITNMVALRWPEHPAIQDKVVRIFGMLLLPVIYVINYGFRTQDWPIYLSVLVFVLLFELVWPLLVFREKGSIRDRLIDDEDAEAKIRARGLFGRINTAFGPGASFALFFLIMGTLIAGAVGKIMAERQTEYLVFADAPNFAIIRIYGDTILAVPFDPVSRTVQSQLMIRKIGTEKTMLILAPKVGPLKN